MRKFEHTQSEVKELIDKVLDNDRNAQKKLFDLYAGRMMTVCLRYARDEHEAKDYLQDAFIRVFKYLPNFKFKGSFEGWVRKIVINSILRSKEKNGKYVFPDKQPSVESTISTPEVISDIAVQELTQLIQNLPEGYQIIFNLYVIDGHTHKEIANLLNISEATSRSQLMRARLRLQNDINKYYFVPTDYHE